MSVIARDQLLWAGLRALGPPLATTRRLSIYLVRIVDLEVVHPVLRRWMDYLFPPRRSVLTTERYGQNHFSVGVLQVTAGQPQVGEATISPESNLTLRHPDIEAHLAFMTSSKEAVQGSCFGP